MRRQLGRQENRRRPVGTTDDPDRRRLAVVKSEEIACGERGYEYPHLRRSTQQESEGTTEQWTEIGQHANAQKDEGRKQFRPYATIIDEGDHPLSVRPHLRQR